MANPVASDSERTVRSDDESCQGTEQRKRLTVTFKNVGIKVNGQGQDFGSTVTSVVASLASIGVRKKPERDIICGVSGQVRPGEMLLVLGRPGSGCTSLLKVISNHRQEFRAVSGEVSFGNMDYKEASQFRHEIVMNTEEDLHFPTLKVEETIHFATKTKVPGRKPTHLANSKAYVEAMSDSTLTSLGIGHTKTTLVGDEFVRGVSGGERKRVSLAEVMTTQAPVQCWDNSTRGLDASNALDFAKLLRASADEYQRSIVATLYQAGNGIYGQFDKVLVLAEGREIYYGPASEAKQYFEDMGLVCAPGANISDFLTSASVHTEREIRPGYENRVPNTTAEFETAYRESALFERMMRDMLSIPEDSLACEVEDLKQARMHYKNRKIHWLSRQSSPYQVSFMSQVIACSKRQFQIIWGDRWSNGLQIASAIEIALVTGSLVYNLDDTTSSLFIRPGALFFPILFFALNKMSETTASFMGRWIIVRHKRLAFNRPAAYSLACTITDVPIVILLLSIFQLCYYFMANFQQTAEKFFINWFIILCTTLCFTSMYRTIGVWCNHFGVAAQISGWVTMVMMVYAGYLIPFNSMHVWFRWIVYLNPAYYAMEAAMINEWNGLTIDCVEPNLIPYGPGYTDEQYRSCSAAGSPMSTASFLGTSYLEAQYSIMTDRLCRDVGIIIVFWVFYSFTAALGLECNLPLDSGSKILFDQRSQQHGTSRLEDTEKTGQADASIAQQANLVSAGATTFTFKDISYYVHHQGKELLLLDNVSGYVKPGQLVALMGSSGAGKTTLMDVLSQRKDSGRIEGSIMVNGKPQDVTFQRTTGYCEQNDVHEPTATVLESLIFSARLRQGHHISDSDKQDYVQRIMDLLELTPLQHALVGSPGSGLSIEQRKRLTLATELVARPSLLFLDEPTSGLDGQSAYQICRFMRKLASSGQTIICTIHQPSATLFEAFDVLLLLAKGGKTTYFGPTGQRSSVVIDYFARHGAPCPPDANPAEHIVDVVQGRFGTNIDWPQEWLHSREKEEAMLELQRLDTLAETTHLLAEDSEELAGKPAESQSFAAPLSYQVVQVTKRQIIALWRNPDYVWNKLGLHISNSLFGGFTFWMIGNGQFDLQLRLMAVFNFVFVAPGCINQMQPLFIRNRDIFETREKKSMTYHWFAFVAAQLISEIPLLVMCGTLYFACWYFTCGFPVTASVSGMVYLEMLLYELLYTSIGQAIAAYSPNAYFAALANPVIIGSALINFCGIVVPYSQIQAFWRYWLYWLNPFTYLMGALLEPVIWDVDVECKSNELTYIAVPSNSSCGEYMADFLSSNTGYVVDPSNTTTCAYCEFSTGKDYLRTLNINEEYYGWRDIGITALFCISSYALVFLMMKLRTKATKTAT